MGNQLTFVDKFRTWFIPLSAVVILWILSSAAWYYHVHSEETKLIVETDVTGEQIKLRLESWIEHRIEIVDKVTTDWDGSKSVDEISFTQKANELLSWTHGLQALNYIDSNWVIKIIVPLKGNEPALGKNLHNHPFATVQNAISQAGKTKNIAGTEIIELLQGGKGFATYSPVLSETGNISGYINGVFKLEKLIESCISEPMLTEKFTLEFYENGKSIFLDGRPLTEAQLKFIKEFPIKFVDKNLMMKIVPTQKYISSFEKYISYWILGFTLLFTLWLGFILRLSMIQNQILKKSEQHFRAVVEFAGDPFYLASKDGEIVDVNQQACIELQYSKEELTSMKITDIDKEVNIEFVLDTLKFHNGSPISFETKHQKKDGSFIPVDMRVGLIDINNEVYLLGLSRNISESKKLQELESRAQRLETAGQVAGQVAHDFNNLLAPLIVYPDFIKEMLDINHPAIEYLDKIEKSANQIAEINQQLLTLGRRGHYTLQSIDLNKLVTQVLEESTLYSPSCKIKTLYDDNLLPILGGYSQLIRIVTNLINNAFDAIKDYGEITIKTENYYLDENTSEYFSVPNGEYVKLTISDTGHGVPEDILQTIFDPFFTTKKADKKRGSGLGLSIVQSVVTDHNGYVDVKSKVGEGTDFYLYFPISRENIEPEKNVMIEKGCEKILVVDDDISILEVTQKILEMLGYNVQTAETGEAAIKLLRKESFDLLILDMIVPNSYDGTETFRRALEIDSSQKAIIVSGYAETVRVEEAMRLGVKSFVKKPFTKEIISRRIREALQERETIAQ